MEFIVATPKKYTDSDIFDKENPGKYLFVRDSKYIVSGCENQEEADLLLSQHNPIKPAELTIEQKLASVGLSLTELKSALLA